jgi:hypothetical protein
MVEIVETVQVVQREEDWGRGIPDTSQTGRERAAPDRTIRSANSPA